MTPFYKIHLRALSPTILLFLAGSLGLQAADPAGWSDNSRPILEPGIAIHSHDNFDQGEDGDDVLTLYDARNRAFTADRNMSTGGTFTHHTWDIGSMGNVYGIAIDRYRNIYTTASANWSSGYYQENGHPKIGYGEIGSGTSTELGNNTDEDNQTIQDDAAAAGAVYKINALTGETSLLATLPQTPVTITNQYCEFTPGLVSIVRQNTGPGLGNIAYDKTHDQFFVSDFSDGRIYRISQGGAILSSFETELGGLQDDNKTMKAPYGLAVSPDGAQLYYGTMETNFHPRLFAVPLNESGDFNGAAIDQHARLNDTGNGLTYTENIGGNLVGTDGLGKPVWASYSDIAFSPSGEMVLGVRVGCRGNFATAYNHGGSVYLLKQDADGHYNTPADQVPGAGNTSYRGDPDGENNESIRSGSGRYEPGLIPIRMHMDGQHIDTLQTGPDDGYGGVAVWERADGTYDFFVSTADISQEQGPHGFMSFPGDFVVADGLIGPAEAFKAVPSSSSSGFHDYKGIGGDVEVLSVLPVRIGSVVWEDKNQDGLQGGSASEPRIAGATVTLLMREASGNFVPAKNIDGETVEAQTTGSDGRYDFGALPEGDYKVRVAPPAGYLPSPVQTATDNDDSEKDSNIADSPSVGVYESGVFTLIAGQEPDEASSDDGDGADGIPDSPEDLRGNMTVDFGFIHVASLGDTVWYDNNSNGLQDANETGVEGITVHLYKDGADTNTTAMTDADGHYTFADLVPGTYHVVFDRDSLPNGYIITAQDQGQDDQNDSDADANGITADAVLDSGENDLDWDMGIRSVTTDAKIYAHIGDFFWLDANGNGIQDPGEKPVVGATVTLFDSEGKAVDDIHGHHSVTTDKNGKYGFDVEADKTYQVHFEIPKNYRDDGYDFTSQNSGSSSQDSDVDATGYTATVTPGKGDNILTLDAGLVCVCINVSGNTIDAMHTISLLWMLLATLTLGLLAMRRQKVFEE